MGHLLSWCAYLVVLFNFNYRYVACTNSTAAGNSSEPKNPDSPFKKPNPLPQSYGSPLTQLFKNNGSDSPTKKKLTAAILLAPGAEEIEVVLSASILRRAGMLVLVAGINRFAGAYNLSRGVSVFAETSIGILELTNNDIIIIPGGLKGVENLKKNERIKSILQNHDKQNRIIGAICAGPRVLKEFGIGFGKTITSYPSVRDELISNGSYKYSEENVVVDGNIITSRGPGTTFDFVLKIVEVALGTAERDRLAKDYLIMPWK